MDAKAVDFVRYPVSDLGASLSSYRDTLGLDLEKHVEEYGWAEFAVPPTTLALDEASPDEGIDPSQNDPAIAIAVDDVDAAVDELRDGGSSVYVEPVDTGVCELAKIGDPDGNPILLHRRHDGTHGRKNAFP